MASRIAISLAAAVAALAAGSAASQPSPPWSTEERLDDSDAAAADEGARYDEHVLRLEAGRRYRLAAHSEDFDTVLELFQEGEPDPVARNDDFGDSLNSRITYVPEETANYRLRVLAFAAEGRGAYHVEASALPPLPPPIRSDPSQRSRGVWLIWDGDLDASDPDRDGSHFDDYVVPMRAGETRLIMLESTSFDTMLWVLAADGRDGEPNAVDDDSGPGANSLLVFQAEDDGDYLVRVTSYGTGVTGAYRLRISEPLTPPPPAAYDDPSRERD